MCLCKCSAAANACLASRSHQVGHHFGFEPTMLLRPHWTRNGGLHNAFTSCHTCKWPVHVWVVNPPMYYELEDFEGIIEARFTKSCCSADRPWAGRDCSGEVPQLAYLVFARYNTSADPQERFVLQCPFCDAEPVKSGTMFSHLCVF